MVSPFVRSVAQLEKLLRRPSAKSIMRTRKREPDLIAIDDEAADEVFSALSSNTARSILTALYTQPRTASEIAAEVETSIQNVNYHINKLSASGLIEVVEVWYSEQGKEMNVYAPSNQALVLFAGDELRRSSLLDAVKRFIGFVGIFALVSVIVERLARPITRDAGVRVAKAGNEGGQATLVLPPGVLFFLGSLLALLAFAAWWHYRSL